MRVKITAEHIAAGKRDNVLECPIAVALNGLSLSFSKRLSFSNWSVMKRAAYMWHGESYFRVSLPENACNWIRDYDAGREVAPFEFDLEVPE